MYVILDLEWVEVHGGTPCPTQIAALRVDRQWNGKRMFGSLIRPENRLYHRWSHMAYKGTVSGSAFRRGSL